MSNRNNRNNDSGRDNLYQPVNNEGKAMYYFQSEADALAAAAGDRTVLRKKLGWVGFSHPRGFADGLEVIDRKKVVPSGTVKQVWAVVLENVGELDMDVDDDWGDDAPSAGPAAAQSAAAPF